MLTETQVWDEIDIYQVQAGASAVNDCEWITYMICEIYEIDDNEDRLTIRNYVMSHAVKGGSLLPFLRQC